jgi:hypothetical protein
MDRRLLAERTATEQAQGRHAMKKSEQYRQYAEDSLHLAGTALDEPQQNRYRRMADAWRALAEDEEWLESRSDASAS